MRKLTTLALTCACCVLAATLPSPQAGATIVRAFSLSSMTTSAQSIVRGTVIDQDVVYDARWGRVYTQSLIEVEEVLWGVESPGELVVLRQIGGELDGVLSMVVGTAPVEIGDEILTFARTADGLHFLVGMAQGLYHVDRRTASEPVVARGVGGLTLRAPPGPARGSAPDRVTLGELRARVTSTLRAEGRLP